MTDSKPIVIGADDAGLGLKGIIKGYLDDLGVSYDDVGVDTPDATALGIDYPDVAETAATGIRDGRYDRGILICGTGIGISMAANRHRHVRAALVHDVTSARLTRQHNNANVLCLGARLTGADVAKDCLKVFLTTDFEGGRHENRVAKLG